MVAPEVVKRFYPDYAKLQHLRGSGVPVLEATISAAGKVTSVRVVRSAHPDLDAALVSALKQWEFRPATLHGRPVAVVFTLTVNIHWQ